MKWFLYKFYFFLYLLWQNSWAINVSIVVQDLNGEGRTAFCGGYSIQEDCLEMGLTLIEVETVGNLLHRSWAGSARRPRFRRQRSK